MEDRRAEVTQMLLAHGRGESGAFDHLVGMVYDDLREVARRQLRQRWGNTLDTTGLVHEAYLKLVDQTRANWQNRGHFFGIAAVAMRQILVDHARRRLAAKRGSGSPHADLEEADREAETSSAEQVLAVHQVLDRLAEIDERLVRVVECRYFAGLTEPETAEALEISPRTVQRDWIRARAWLKKEMGGAPVDG